jgi:hypothetical protein
MNCTMMHGSTNIKYSIDVTSHMSVVPLCAVSSFYLFASRVNFISTISLKMHNKSE